MSTTAWSSPRVRQISHTCYGCPDQWTGELSNGQYFIIHNRHGKLKVGVGKTLVEATEAICGMFTEGVVYYNDKCDCGELGTLEVLGLIGWELT